MRPSGLELIAGVKTLLATAVLPGIASPYLRTQVALAIGLLDAAAAELNDAPAAYDAERQRARELAAEVALQVEAAAADDPLVQDLADIAALPAEPPDRSTKAMEAESVWLLGIIDRLSALCEAHPDLAETGARVDAELRAQVRRRLAWGSGPGG